MQQDRMAQIRKSYLGIAWRGLLSEDRTWFQGWGLRASADVKIARQGRVSKRLQVCRTRVEVGLQFV